MRESSGNDSIFGAGSCRKLVLRTCANVCLKRSKRVRRGAKRVEQSPDRTAAAGDPSLAHRADDLIQRQIRMLTNQHQQPVGMSASALKKSLHAAEQERPDVARARRRWMREQGMFDPARLVFIDETSTSTNMVRLRG